MQARYLRDLLPRHHQIVELVMDGLPNGEIAEIVGCTPQTISNVRNGSEVQHMLALRHARIAAASDDRRASDAAEVSEAIRSRTLDAVKRLGMVLDHGKDRDALRAAEAILDRGGFPRVQRTEAKSVAITLDSNDVSRLAETLAMVREERPAPAGAAPECGDGSNGAAAERSAA